MVQRHPVHSSVMSCILHLASCTCMAWEKKLCINITSVPFKSFLNSKHKMNEYVHQNCKTFVGWFLGLQLVLRVHHKHYKCTTVACRCTHRVKAPWEAVVVQEVACWTVMIHPHNHPTQLGREQQLKIASEVKQKAKANAFPDAAK